MVVGCLDCIVNNRFKAHLLNRRLAFGRTWQMILIGCSSIIVQRIQVCSFTLSNVLNLKKKSDKKVRRPRLLDI